MIGKVILAFLIRSMPNPEPAAIVLLTEGVLAARSLVAVNGLYEAL